LVSADYVNDARSSIVDGPSTMVIDDSPQPRWATREVPEARLWGALLTAIPLVLAIALGAGHLPRFDLLATAGLGVFGFAFAVISSPHSYLILAYAGSEKAAEDVGFYYAANAAGRLVGILLSGVLAQLGGLAACL
jgi:hypothetical protein